jgi:RHS repeat-associated protein
VYDVNGRRVEKKTSTGQTDYLYDTSGNVTGEWQVISGYTGPSAHYAYMNGHLVAEYTAGTTYFVHKDHLGSTRLVTSSSGSVCDSMDYLPFGEQITGGSCATHKFTGKERDTETASTSGGTDGLDNFGARYYSSSLGHFMSPDPGNAGAANDDPQSWNAFSYVRNNPLNFTDPTGAVFCRPANDDEQAQGLTLVCDVSNSQYVNSDKDQQAAYDKAGYTHYDCSCDTGADLDAWQHPNGNAGPDYWGYAAMFVGSYFVVEIADEIGSLLELEGDPDFSRLPQDIGREADYPKPPPENGGNGTIGTNPNQAEELGRDLRQAEQQGARDIRVNQEQVNAQGVRVGQNRPDLQYTDKAGMRHYIEYDQSPESSAAHEQRIKANDPSGIVTPKIIK